MGAYSLQLVVYGLNHNVLLDLLAICRSIGHFKHSSVACHKSKNSREFILSSRMFTLDGIYPYMIQSILEQKMALAAYAAENDIPQLTASHLARKMTLVLTN